MSLANAWKHLKTINRHKKAVMQNCFKMGLYRQGLLHDLTKYAPVEFRTGARYYQGDRSPNNKEREEIGLSYSWLHHKGKNKHHFEYWIDYGVNCDTIICGVRMPKKYVAEMVADRVGASKVYLGPAYSPVSPYIYFSRSRERLWFVHEEVKDQLQYLLGRLAVEGEDKAFSYIRHVYLRGKKEPWTRPDDFDTIIQMADKAAQNDKTAFTAIENSRDSVHA